MISEYNSGNKVTEKIAQDMRQLYLQWSLAVERGPILEGMEQTLLKGLPAYM